VVRRRRAERAKELRRQVDAGGDPAGEKRERREAPTIKDLLDRYVAEHLVTKTAGSVSPKLAAQRRKDEEAMLAEIGQRLGLATKVADVHHGDVKQMHQDISASIGERTGRPRPVRANRILAVCSKAFSLSLVPQAGENKPWRDAAAGNPCKGVARNREEGKEQFYSGTELAIIGDVLADHGKDAQEPGRSVAKAAADAARLAMFTGARPQEVIFGTWPQFDAEPGYWVKPSAHTKQRKVHKLPLSPPALELIERLRKERKGAHWLFPGAKGRPVAAFWHVWSAVQVALWRASRDPNVAAIVADLESALGRRPSAELCRKEAKRRNLTLPQNRLYDLRHTVGAIGAGGGLSLPIIGKLLGHTQARTTARYSHIGDDPLKEAADKIGRAISGAGKKKAPTSCRPCKAAGRERPPHESPQARAPYGQPQTASAISVRLGRAARPGVPPGSVHLGGPALGHTLEKPADASRRQ
jgi:integrase